MKIRAQLGLGFGTILVLLTIVGLTGVYQLNQINHSYQNNVDLQWKLMEDADMMVVDVLQVLRNEKDFLLYKDMGQMDQVNDFLNSALGESKKASKYCNQPVGYSKRQGDAAGYS